VLTEIDFIALARKETNARKKMRYLALAHFKEGSLEPPLPMHLK